MILQTKQTQLNMSANKFYKKKREKMYEKRNPHSFNKKGTDRILKSSMRNEGITTD